MKRTLTAAVTAAGILVGSLAASPLALAGPTGPASPDQDQHRTDFVDDDPCDYATQKSLHPWEQWVTGEWDRYNGTTSFTNNSDRPIKFSLEVTEGVNESVNAMSSGNMWDVFFHGVHDKYGIVETSEWAVGDKLGPVVVQPGDTVRADYGVHMKSFIGRVRTCDKRTELWRTEGAFGKYKGEGPSTRFVVWHRTTQEGRHFTNYVPVSGNSGSHDSGPNSATIDGK